MACRVILYGAGVWGQRIGHMLKSYEDICVVCYLDGNPDLSGTEIEGVPVVSPEKITELTYEYVIACSKNSDYKEEMKRELINRNVEADKILLDPFLKELQNNLRKSDKLRLAKDCIYLVFQKEHLDKGLEIGECTWYAPRIHGDENCAHIKIGKYCGIARDVVVFRGGEVNWKNASLFDFKNFLNDYEDVPWRKRSKGNVVIGNDVLLYSGVKVLSGVTIGNGAVVAANSLVGKDIPPYAVAWGVPAKVVMYRFDAATREKLEEMQWWDWDYDKLYDAVPLLQNEDIDALYEYYLRNVKG